MPRTAPRWGAAALFSAVTLTYLPAQEPALETTAFSRDDTARGAVATPAGPETAISPTETRYQRETRISRSSTRRGATRPARPSEPATVRTPLWARACTDDDRATTHPNGQVPDGELCSLPLTGHRLHSDAARAWGRLNRAYRNRFSAPLCLTDSYRSLSAQQSLYSLKPGLAAPPGTSNHGWGVAVDLCGGVETGASAAYRWLSERARENGWVNPGWAQPTGSRPEPWHWEYLG